MNCDQGEDPRMNCEQENMFSMSSKKRHKRCAACEYLEEFFSAVIISVPWVKFCSEHMLFYCKFTYCCVIFLLLGQIEDNGETDGKEFSIGAK